MFKPLIVLALCATFATMASAGKESSPEVAAINQAIELRKAEIKELRKLRQVQKEIERANKPRKSKAAKPEQVSV
jgi:hypothetical protein